MIFLIPVFGLIFLLTLLLKLIGGHISWLVIIIFAVLFILPIIALIILGIISKVKEKNSQDRNSESN
ncbi:MAG: hypothetical protein NTU49_11035 [Gammaproteobacteria bacterium]|nr:hypothetical protein [Gammaproteobacteria bacterium]